MSAPAFEIWMYQMGSSVAAALLDQSRWRHRVVVSLALLEGRRARRRVSLDCSPQNIRFRMRTDLAKKARLVPILPLAMIAKGTIRSLDVVDDQGRAIPVLTRRGNATVAAATVGAVLEIYAGYDLDEDRQLWEQVWEMVNADEGVGHEMFETHFAEIPMEPAAKDIIRDFAGGFLLSAIIDRNRVDQRGVFKYSYHWESWTVDRSIVDYVAAGFGLTDFALDVDEPLMTTAESYHFECDPPALLAIRKLELPAGGTGRAHIDRPQADIAHVHGRFAGVAVHDSRVKMTVRGRGPALARLAAGSAATFVTCTALLADESLLGDLSREGEVIVALVLAAVAGFFVWTARPGENSLESRLFRAPRLGLWSLGVSAIAILGLMLRDFGTAVEQAVLTLVAITSLGLLALTGAGILRRFVRRLD